MVPDYVLQALFVGVGLLALALAHGMLKGTAKWLPRLGLHAAMGLTALLCANCLGSLAGLGLGLNRLTLPVSAILGVPGVGLLWTIRYLL